MKIKTKQICLKISLDLPSLNNFQKLAKPSKMGICELVFCLVVLFWY